VLGIIVQLILSWFILRIIEKQNLSVLGFLPLRKRVAQLIIGFLFAGLLYALVELINSGMTNLAWELNDNLSYTDIPNYLWWNFKSVMFEELIFRGALLYIAIQRLGAKKGILLSATCFGIYHWFSYGLFGDIASMIMVFLITGLMGLVWAFGFSKLKSMALPIGLHLGWNFTNNAIFSKGPMGEQILIPIKGVNYVQLTGVPSLVIFFTQTFGVALLMYLLIKFYSQREFKN